MDTKILIGADIVPTKSNYVEFIEGDVETLVGKTMCDLLHEMDFTIFNLEVPLTDVISPIQKCGPNLQALSKTVNGIKKINPYFFTLANNHILDQSVQGLKATMEILNRENIKYAGAGNDLKEASKPFVFEKNGIKIGIYCCAETEFSIATENKAGANPFDPLFSLDHIRLLKKDVNYVIVLYHGGKEHYRFPSPNLQKTCRRIVDSGADLVVCQHSHCIGCYEDWETGKIIYGQGNFLFDDSDSEFWKTSLLIEIIFKSKNDFSIEYIPIVKVGNGIRLAENEKKVEIINGFEDRSKRIIESAFIETEYSKFAQQYINTYLRTGMPHNTSLFNRVFNKLSKGTWFERRITKEQKLALCNYLECEAHRELFLQGLKESLRKSS